MRIAFLGLGAMGSRMAARLAAEGEVVVWNRTPRGVDGADVAATPAAATEGSDVVIAMVRDDPASRAVWTGPEGALVGLRAGAVAVEASTLTPGWITELGGLVAGRGATLLDAPVVGSRPQAEQGALVHLVGGPADVLDRLSPVFAATGCAVHAVGGLGSGTAVKLAVNALFAVQVAALGEALGFLARSGVGVQAATTLLAQLPVTSPALAGVGGLVAAGRFEPMFPVALVHKDLGYAHDAAVAVGAETPTADAVRAVYARTMAAGEGAANLAVVARRFLPD